MTGAWFVRAALGLLPALCFLGALLLLDSYKLVRLRTVLAVIVTGGIVAGVCYVLNRFALRASGLEFSDYARFVAPLVEETLKAGVVLVLIRTRRIGFLVDAAVLGFAVGAGFAIVENLYYLSQSSDTHVATWIVRGFGTAILHGGVQAIFAALVLTNADSRSRLDARAVLPPLALAVLVHAAFNQFALPPIYETLLVLLSIPLLLAWLSCTANGCSSAGSAAVSMPTRNCSACSAPKRFRNRTPASICTNCASAFAARSSPTCCAICACTSSSRCARRAC